MKKLLFTILMLVTPITLCAAQDITFDSLMTEYSTKSNCTTINISGVMLKSLGIEGDVDFLKVIAIDDAALIPQFMVKVESIVADMDNIMSVNADGESVQIYQREGDRDRSTQMIIITMDDDECVLMHISGRDLEASDFSKLMKI